MYSSVLSFVLFLCIDSRFALLFVILIYDTVFALVV